MLIDINKVKNLATIGESQRLEYKKSTANLKDILEMLSMAIYMGGGPSLMYAADALKTFEEFSG